MNLKIILILHQYIRQLLVYYDKVLDEFKDYLNITSIY
jgi:hypothetical protein